MKVFLRSSVILVVLFAFCTYAQETAIKVPNNFTFGKTPNSNTRDPNQTQAVLTALPNNGYFSSSTKGPNAGTGFQRTSYIITAAEMAASHIPSGVPFNSIGFNMYAVPPAVATTGNFKVYLSNTSDATYLKGNNWPTIITGATLACNGTITIPTTTGTYDVSFTGGSTFTYTGGAVYIAFEFQNTGTVAPAVTQYLINNQTGTWSSYGISTTRFSDTLTTNSAARPETRIGAVVGKDASVDAIYTLGELPKGSGTPHIISAAIRNSGDSAITALPCTLKVSGANSFTNIQTIASLPIGATVVVSFSSFSPAATGNDTVTVTIPSDALAFNNSKTLIQTVNTTNSFNYSDTSHNWFDAWGLAAGVSGSYVSKFYVNGYTLLNSTRVFVYNGTGNTVRGVAFNKAGAVIAQSADHVLQATDLLNWVTFNFITPVAVNFDSVYVGLYSTGAASYYPICDEVESPVRSGSFFSISSTGAITDLASSGWLDGKWMIEANFSSPNLSGDYYIPQGTNPQGFTTLAAACATINANGVSAPVRFLINGNLTETAANLIITSATVTATNTLTILPNTSTNDTITMSGCATTGNNTKAGFTIYGTNYVTINGSNGTGSGLTFSLSDATNGLKVLVINGGSSNITAQNCSFKFASSPVSGTYVIYVGANAVPVPSNVTLKNNNLAQTGILPQYGIYFQGSYGPPILGFGEKIQNCNIKSYQACITLNDVGTAAGPSEVSGNTLTVGSVTASSYVEGMYLAYLGGTVNVFNNKTLSLTTNAASGSGLLGMAIYGVVSLTDPPVFNIYNNFISGFTINSTAYAGPVYGIWFENSTDETYTANVYFNTIYINSTGGKATGEVAAIGRLGSLVHLTMTMKDNILYNDNNTATSYAANFPGSGGTEGPLVSDYNDLYVSGLGTLGVYNATTCANLAAWKTASGNDAHSVSKQTFFVSNVAPFDLHLTGTSNGDISLAGIPISGITTDIDGQTRNASGPYMGADEASIPVPVELTSFTASVANGVVNLSWKTATEINNSGFEVQRKGVNDNTWSTLAFVKGSGNSLTTKQYSYSDNSANSGKFNYRLKQIDQNGTFNYSDVVNVNVNVPGTFSMSQNYPNPFNPSTKIDYQVPVDSKVNIELFSITGKKVADLVNTDQGAGFYSINVGANTFKNISSGVYIYKMTAFEKVSGKNFVSSKKLMLLK